MDFLQTIDFMSKRKDYDKFSLKIAREESVAKDLKQEGLIKVYTHQLPVDKIYNDGLKALDCYFYGVMSNIFRSKVFKIRYELNKNMVKLEDASYLEPTKFVYEYKERDIKKEKAEEVVYRALEFTSDDTNDTAYKKRLYYWYTIKGNISEISRETNIPLRTLQKDFAELKKELKLKYEYFINH